MTEDLDKLEERNAARTRKEYETADSLKKGLRWSLPVLLGILPIGATFGLLSQQAGLDVWATAGMSLFVAAGTSQFMAVSMLVGGMDVLPIVAAAFIVNFRNMLMSASLAPRVASWSVSQRLLLGALVTDESFVLHSAHFERGDMDSLAAITLNGAMYAVWGATTVAGFYLGELVARPEALGLDFTLQAMFIGLLTLCCAGRPAVLAALCGGAAAVALCLAGAGNWAAFGGAAAGATAGLLGELVMDTEGKRS